MKKLFCICIVCLLFLTGCKSQVKNITPVTKNISFTCDIIFYNESYECTVTNTKKDGFNLKYTLPESINGLEYNIKNEKIFYNFKGITYDSPKNLSHENIANFIYSALECKKSTVFENNDNFYIKGNGFKMYLGQTGLPLKIVNDNNTITVTIKNATIK